MEDRKNQLRLLPKMDALLATEGARRHERIIGRRAVVEICRAAVERAKSRVLETGQAPDVAFIETDVAAGLRSARARLLHRVVNGTGVLLHTNLGRAPLGRRLVEAVAEAAAGYCNLEIDVLERQRDARGAGVTSLLVQACECEDALVVNNNAAALFLILRELADGREVIVSRGELVQIGGGFRIPDILTSSGATLREVGTTNITSLEDYSDAVTERTALLLKVHRSNFRMDGFVDAPAVRELAELRRADTLLVCDLGAGNLVRDPGLGAAADEPTPADLLRQGADLVCFSGDKMLGGPQAGIIVGRADLVGRLRRNPILRVVRADKLAYAALQAVLLHHLRGEHGAVQLWSMALAGVDAVRARATAFVARHGLDPRRFEIVASTATFGGGSTPGSEIPSAAIRISSERPADDVARLFQEHEPPVVGTVRDGRFHVDFRTVLDEDEPHLAAACLKLES